LPPKNDRGGASGSGGFPRHLKAWLDHLMTVKVPDSKSAIALAESLDVAPLEQLLRQYTDRISPSNYAEVSSWTFELRSTVFAEINFYERFLVLGAELNFALSHVRSPPFASGLAPLHIATKRLLRFWLTASAVDLKCASWLELFLR